MQTKQDHAHCAFPRQRENFPKIEIERQQHPVLGRGLAEDVIVCHSLKAFLMEVLCIMALRPQPFHDPHGHTHVREKPHPSIWSSRDDFLLCQPGGVFEGLLHIFFFQVGIICQHLLGCRTLSELTHNNRDGNSHAANAGPPAHDGRIKCNTVERHSRNNSLFWHREQHRVEQPFFFTLFG